ncbi:hypothetical protein HMPREF9598_00036 [Cutibacterium acnes HL050PA1]|nr:hypothetical protein HMPREF9567_02217 [Cutibacterium acnes HL013PA1]EFS41851.1 hypothetical protein HMPREF9575_00367 [Cutibacterium acnes HL110PA1]EFS83279.1 hypothetical protein HMPREF9598_00036 [Cutibacterium acnes HL050PA1]EGF71394.1 hypothetical protein HMPREF9588_01048 [Cutibacterium acnes HL025PA2]
MGMTSRCSFASIEPPHPRRRLLRTIGALRFVMGCRRAGLDNRA